MKILLKVFALRRGRKCIPVLKSPEWVVKATLGSHVLTILIRLAKPTKTLCSCEYATECEITKREGKLDVKFVFTI